jgi:hypothetical protein
MGKRAQHRKRRGRPPGQVPIEQNPQRFEIAAWWAFRGMGLGPFDAARRALLAVKGGDFSVEDIEGLLQLASAEIPLPEHDPDEPDAGLRRLAAKARRQKASRWLTNSVGMVHALVVFTGEFNWPGVCAAIDVLITLGWGPAITGFRRRLVAALEANLAPADLEKLRPSVRRMLGELREKSKRLTAEFNNTITRPRS